MPATDAHPPEGRLAPLCRSLKDWKQLELFEREAQTLKGLEHKSAGQGQGRGRAGIVGRVRQQGGAGVRHACPSCALKLHLTERAAPSPLAIAGIPRYLDYFEQDTEQDRAFFLVQVRVRLGGALAEQ